MTFMVAYLNAEGNPVWRVSVFWTAIGVAAMLAPWIWPRLLQKRNPVTGFATLVGINAFATALPIFITSFPGAISSALIFGSTFFAVVSSTTEYVRRNCQKPQHTAAIGAFTLAFGIGQTSGPFLIGRITDYCGSLSAGLLTGTALIAISAILSISQLPNRNVTSPPT
jgi:predicted MFS family arabinose efflux permease